MDHIFELGKSILKYCYKNVLGPMGGVRNHSNCPIPWNSIMSTWENREDSKKQIAPNKISGYSSTQEYLDVHFHLLLEDFLSPLRKDLKFLSGDSCNYENKVSLIAK